MRAWLPMLLALLFSGALPGALPSAADEAPQALQALFESACDAYRRGAWAEAQAGWEGLLEEPDLSPEDRSRLARNAGNAAWRAGRRGEALGWFTAALRLDPSNDDARANRDLARAEAGIAPARGGDLRSSVEGLLERWSPAERRRGMALALGLLALVLLAEALRGGAALRAAALAAGLVLAAAAAPWLWGMAHARPAAPALVVADPSVALRSEPRESLDPIGKVFLGEEVERIDALPGWVRLRTEQGLRGWVPERSVFALDR